MNSYDLLARDILLHVLSRSNIWERTFVQELELDKISPRQRWWLYNACVKFRRYISNVDLLNYCWEYLMENREPPLSRNEATLILRENKPPREKKVKKPKAKKEPSPYMDIGDFQEQHNMWADTFKEAVKEMGVPTIGNDKYLITGLKEVAQEFITGKRIYFQKNR